MAYLFLLLLAGLIVGALGRALVPGPNPMGIVLTTLVGIAGSLIGGIAGNLFLDPPAAILCALLGAAFVVWVIEWFRRPSRTDVL